METIIAIINMTWPVSGTVLLILAAAALGKTLTDFFGSEK